MKPIFTALLFSLCITLNAQFPNLIETDLDGVEHNLQEDYLNNGKPVLVHFFAGWNIWDQYFLDTASMQFVYDIFGPDGTDQIMMLAYEIDPGTTDEMLMGGQPNFDYDYTEAYNFPILNPDTSLWSTIMNVNAMPGVAIFCPDGTIYVDGQGVQGPDNYPDVVADESIFYGELLVPEGITNAFENSCGIFLADETLSGHLTIDINGTCDQDFDNPVSDGLVYIDNGTSTIIRSSNSLGLYEALLLDGTYDLSFDPQSSLLDICEQPGSIVINGNIVSDADAIFNASVYCPEIILEVEPWLIRPCDRTSVMHTSVCNRGTADASNFVINIQFPADTEILTVSTTDPWNYEQTTGLFTMAVSGIGLFECIDLNFSFHTPCTTMVNDTLCYTMTTEAIQILPECDDYIETEETDCGVVIGSYDPNDKQGLTPSVGENHYIEDGTSLEYKIRFQNTGNDTAFRIRIEDLLPAELIHETVRPIASSHDYTMSLVDGNLEFFFDNILLVDSFTNEPESHGFITFSVDSRSELQPGTAIDNTAAIFFDSNEPIITNTFTYTTNLPASNQDTELIDFGVHPNPVNAMLYLEKSFTKDAYAYIMDINGRLLITEQLSSEGIDVSNLMSGTYFIKVMKDGNTISTTEKFVVVR